MKIPYFEVDAFTSRIFSGNPAGVCPLPEWLDDATLQSIAAENNLPETAFFVGRRGEYDLRWFAPRVEIDLCGHATLASAFILFSEYDFGGHVVRFNSKGGTLTVARSADILTLDFPSRPPKPFTAPDALIRALDREPVEVLKARDYMVVLESESDVQSLKPDFALLGSLDEKVIVTARGTEVDFVSRFFAPTAGVPEDPVTGSSHCTLIPYWSQQLGKTKLLARQLSERGGELFCEQAGDRVSIGGRAVLYLRGEIEVSEGS